MIGRVIWIAALVVIGVITAQLQFDRQSARNPGMVDMVAVPFRGYSQPSITAAALLSDDPSYGLIEAQRLVQRRPLPAEHLTLLAQAYAKVGDLETASLAIQVAAQRGWRDPLPQEAIARLALLSGDVPEATRRFTALMVLGRDNDELLSDLAGEIFGEPLSPGIVTLADIISGTERWQKTFLRRGPRIMPPDAFAAVMQASSEQGAWIECAQLERAARSIRRQDLGASDAAETIANLPCTNRGKLRV